MDKRKIQYLADFLGLLQVILSSRLLHVSRDLEYFHSGHISMLTIEYFPKITLYQFLQLTLNVNILRLENIFCEKIIIYGSKSWTFSSYAFFDPN